MESMGEKSHRDETIVGSKVQKKILRVSEC